MQFSLLAPVWLLFWLAVRTLISPLIYLQWSRPFTVCVEPFKIDDKIASGQMTILDQTSLIKFATLHCHRTTEIYEMLQEVYDDSTIHHCTILHLCQRFYQGQNNNKPRHIVVGWEFIEKTHQQPLLLSYWRKRHMTCTEIAMESRIPQSSVHHVETGVMEKRKAAAWWVSHMSDKRKMQKDITTQLLACYQKDKKSF